MGRTAVKITHVELFNGTELSMSAAQGLDSEGRPMLVVIAKGTYAFPTSLEAASLDAVPRFAEQQRDILRADVFEGEPGLSFPLLESDQVPHKPACDVVHRLGRHLRSTVAGRVVSHAAFLEGGNWTQLFDALQPPTTSP